MIVMAALKGQNLIAMGNAHRHKNKLRYSPVGAKSYSTDSYR